MVCTHTDEKIKNEFICVDCKEEVILKNDKKYHCKGCMKEFEIVDNIPIFLKKAYSEYSDIEPEYKKYFSNCVLIDIPGLENHPSGRNKIVSEKEAQELLSEGVLNTLFYRNKYYENEKWLRLKDFLEDINKTKKKGEVVRVLDIGCATGDLIDYFSEKYPNYEFIGADIVLEALIAAKNLRETKVKYICLDGEYLPFSDNYFDIIISINSLEHAGPQMMGEIYRVLKKSGHLFLIFPSHHSYIFCEGWGGFKLLTFMYLMTLILRRKFESYDFHGPVVKNLINQLDKHYTILKYDAYYFRFLQEYNIFNKFPKAIVGVINSMHKIIEKLFRTSEKSKKYLFMQHIEAIKK